MQSSTPVPIDSSAVTYHPNDDGMGEKSYIQGGVSPVVMDARRPFPSEALRFKKWIVPGMLVVIVGLIAALITVAVTKKVSDPNAMSFDLGSDVIMKAQVFKYTCTANQCVRQNLTKAEILSQTPTMGPGLMSLRVCEMTCGSGSMLPLPQSITFASAETVAVDVTSFSHSVSGADGSLVKDMQAAFTELVELKKKLAVGGIQDSGKKVSVVGKVESSSTSLTLETDESYSLSTSGTTVTITAKTIFGYRHGLASLLQLVDWCDITRSHRMVASVTVQDKPAFHYRGVSVDTARNFFPLATLRRLLRTMGMHKLNVFHWHLTDSASFGVEIKREPKFNQYGTVAANMVYTQAQVAALVAYGKVHGVLIIPEIDAPAHAGAGWQWGPDFGLGELVLCWADEPWKTHCLEAPCGQLNPLNDNVVTLLDGVWTELGTVFDSGVFHMGGDEVYLQCWQDSPAVSSHVVNTTEKAEYFSIWATFQQKSQEKLWSHMPQQKVMLWSSDLTTSEYISHFPKDKVIIQAWDKLSMNEPRSLTDAGYQVIASFQEAHYLDCGLNGVAKKNNGWCAPYKTWQVMYDQELAYNVTAENLHLVLGGEVVLWSEVTGAAAMDDKVWPRTAAFAERAWTNLNATWDKVMARMTIASHRIVESGVGADMIQPHWCRQNPGQCTLLLD
ncbi:Aste57867_19038 [Aphanomyces stellatus]|uniref:Beta-hexosaminidase n=1 Tax=Aphanomyces stellatus TaxID=120398 RepID=A0A485LDK3_9STRA|nr:hypothetical protein As57867_018974 [Aphanomyces stellatus]VFT95763.1 Aste57867_19038 [Aphanomyces stellatus]